MPQNMSLVINVALTGNQNQRGGWSLAATYSQGATNPPSSNVVDSSTGNITLANMAMTSDYNAATQVTFAITSVNVTDRSGRPATVYFASPRTSAIRFDPATAWQEFTGFGDDGSGLELTFLDLDDDHASYTYCLTVTCFENGSTSGTNVALDPRFVNRP